MLRLRWCVLTRFISSPPASPIPFRLLSAAAAPVVSPNPSGFAVEEYLVSTCGLTRSQALKASPKLSHLKSPAKPDGVLAFLAGLGLSGADVASVVAKDPKVLCAGVERTLAPNVAGLAGLGLSRSDIARLVPVAGVKFRRRSIVSRLRYYLPLAGSLENLLRALKKCLYLLTADLDRVVKPNVALFRDECLLGACDIAKLFNHAPKMISTNPEHNRAMVAYVQGIGIPRGSGMFWVALNVVTCLPQEKIAAKVEYLKNTFRWSDAEMGIALSKSPTLLNLSKDFLRSRSEFLISEVGLEPLYIAQRPTMITLSLEGRLRPRYYAVKFLKQNGLLKRDPSYTTVFKMTDKAFRNKFICSHEESAPHLAQDYDLACKGEVPTNFRFT